MDPLRRALFLVLFASVLATEPAHARALSGVTDSPTLPAAQATIRWVRQLAVTLRCASEPTQIQRPPYVEVIASRLVTGPQLMRVHPTVEPHAFRTPPPLRQG